MYQGCIDENFDIDVNIYLNRDAIHTIYQVFVSGFYRSLSFPSWLRVQSQI